MPIGSSAFYAKQPDITNAHFSLFEQVAHRKMMHFRQEVRRMLHLLTTPHPDEKNPPSLFLIGIHSRKELMDLLGV